jgi:hypothetical protein
MTEYPGSGLKVGEYHIVCPGRDRILVEIIKYTFRLSAVRYAIINIYRFKDISIVKINLKLL